MYILLDSEIVIVESKSLGMVNIFFQNSCSLRNNYKKCGGEKAAKEAINYLFIIW
jgi:hypothetical protein